MQTLMCKLQYKCRRTRERGFSTWCSFLCLDFKIDVPGTTLHRATVLNRWIVWYWSRGSVYGLARLAPSRARGCNRDGSQATDTLSTKRKRIRKKEGEEVYGVFFRSHL